jgi:hypothetical protein
MLMRVGCSGVAGMSSLKKRVEEASGRRSVRP